MKTWVAVVAAVLLGSGVASANISCGGKITYLGLGTSGMVTVNVGFGTWYLCEMTSAFAGNGGITFSPEGCRAIYAGLLAAQKADHPVSFSFASPANTTNGPECSLGSWVVPNPSPYHVSFTN